MRSIHINPVKTASVLIQARTQEVREIRRGENF